MVLVRAANSYGSFSSVVSDFEDNDFDIVKRLGSGFFSDVFLVKYNGNNYVKKTAKSSVSNAEDELDNERKILAQLNHQNIVSLVAALEGSNSIILELCSKGELAMYIENMGAFKISQARFYAKAIASGLEYLHSRSILHNDIKAENVIIGVDNLPKLTDFGNSRLLIDDEPEMLLTGTPESLSPEMITSQGYSFPRDWWSFGVLVYQMITGEMPFTGADELQVYVAILTQSPKLDIIEDDAAIDLLEGLLNKDPSERAEHDHEHPFYKGVEEPVTNDSTQLISHVGIPIKRPSQ